MWQVTKIVQLVVLLLLAESLVLPGEWAFAGECNYLYADALKNHASEELTAIKSDFAHNTHYTLEIGVPPVRDQCEYGSCWIHGTLGEIEQDLFKHGRSLDLSEQYLIIQSLKEKAVETLRKPGKIVKPGGSFLKANELIKRYGLMPASVWKPRVAFEESPLSKRLLDFLNGRAAQYHIESAKWMTLIQKKRLFDQARKDLGSIIEAFSGAIPEKFVFENRTLTPLQFRDELIGDRQFEWHKIGLLTDSLPEKLKKSKVEKDPELKRRKESLEKIEEIIIDSLKKGHSVPVSVEMAHGFIDDRTGIMSIHAFYLPKGFNPPTRAYRKAFDENHKLSGTDHLMVIVGVDLDESGKVIKYKVRNSHGEEQGDHGYYHLYPDYFREYLNSIAVRGDALTQSTIDNK